MKLECPRKEFFEAVQAAAAASQARGTIPVYQNLLIDAQSSGMRVLGCDGELWIERILPCVVTEPGSTLLQAKLLTELLSKLADGDIQIRTLEGSGAMLTQGVSEYRLQTLEAEDFPEPPDYGGENEILIQIGLLREAVDSVSYAVSTESHRQVLTGVLFKHVGESLTLVATDTHRLAVRSIQLSGTSGSVEAVVPEKALRAIKSLPIPDDTKVELRMGLNRLGVRAGGAQIVAQLLAGAFPNWERVVPGEATRSWSVEIDQLEEKLRRAMILARDNANRVRFRGSDSQMLIAARSDEKGEAKEELAIVSDNGEIEIAFNGSYVLEALQPIAGDGVRIEMTESSRPAIFRPADEQSGYFCVIMPMALA